MCLAVLYEAPNSPASSSSPIASPDPGAAGSTEAAGTSEARPIVGGVPPRGIEFVFELSWVGGLNNLRGHMLQSLFYALAIKNASSSASSSSSSSPLPQLKFTVRAGAACLKLRNMQYGLDFAAHRYQPPFEWVRLTPARSRRFPKLKLTEYCAVDAFQHLYSWPHFVAAVKGFGFDEVLPATAAMMLEPRERFSAAASSARSIGKNASGEYDDVYVVDDDAVGKRVSWRALMQAQQDAIAAYVEAARRSPAGTRRVVLVRSRRPERFLSHIHQCPEIPGCMDLDQRVFRPSDVVASTFVDPVLAAIRAASPSFVAVHFRTFNCGDGGSNLHVARRIHELLVSLVKNRELAALPKTLYLATGMQRSQYADLEAVFNYTVLSKESVSGGSFTTLRFPFEVMALVDQMVATEADDVVTMTGRRGSTWASFIDLARKRSGKRRVLESTRECH